MSPGPAGWLPNFSGCPYGKEHDVNLADDGHGGGGGDAGGPAPDPDAAVADVAGATVRPPKKAVKTSNEELAAKRNGVQKLGAPLLGNLVPVQHKIFPRRHEQDCRAARACAQRYHRQSTNSARL